MSEENNIRVLLFRTGPTQWEASGRIGGSSDVPLSPQGREHVGKCVCTLAGVQLSTVYCGPDEASQATARELAAATGAKVKVVDDLAEIHLGLWEGLLASDLQDKCPTAYRQWMDDPASVSAPDGESVDDVQARVLDTVGRLIEKTRPSSGAIAFVLRPVALGLVECALQGQSCQKIWESTRNGYLPQWRTLSKATAHQVRELAKSPVRR